MTEACGIFSWFRHRSNAKDSTHFARIIKEEENSPLFQSAVAMVKHSSCYEGWVSRYYHKLFDTEPASLHGVIAGSMPVLSSVSPVRHLPNVFCSPRQHSSTTTLQSAHWP